MKSTIILIAVLIASGPIAIGQNGQLKNEQTQAIQRLINLFKAFNKVEIANLIHYPLKREYPLKDIKDKYDLIQRFDVLFDEEFVKRIANSKISDWSEVGWRGIMFDNGMLWIDETGKISSVNYQSSSEKEMFADAVQADKNKLPRSLREFVKPVYLIFTKTYKIRIDEKAEGVYRYAAWKLKNPKVEADLVIEKGVAEFQGNGGNYSIVFKNDPYTYIVSINNLGTAYDPDATIEVLKQDRSILTEEGKIKRN